MSDRGAFLDWLGPAPDQPSAPADPGAAESSPAPEGDTSIDPPRAGGRVVTVAGAHGGSGATVVAVVLSMVAGTTGTAAVLDGTVIGGDLLHRAPADIDVGCTWHHWVTDPHRTLPHCRWVALGRDRAAAPHGLPLAAAAGELAAAGRTVVVDAGACVGSAWFDELAAVTDHLLLTVDDRPGAANASRPVLSMVRSRLGSSQMGRSVQIVVTSQRPGVDHVTGPLTDALAGRVAGVHHVPYDPELAAGVEIDTALLSAASIDLAHAVLAHTDPITETPAHRKARP